MKQKKRRCLKCGRPVYGSAWLCPECRQENRQIAAEAEGVSDLYHED